MMPADALETLARYDAILLAAIGWSTVPDHISAWGLILPIRNAFEQYVNLRPVKFLPGVPQRVAGVRPSEVDIVFVRENTEGDYSGAGGFLHSSTDAQLAVEVPVVTRTGIARAARYASALASERSRRLISVTKSNASRYAYVLWDQVVNDVTAEWPQLVVERVHADAMAARMVMTPVSIDVVLASNLFGDSLADLGAAI
jgi:tartrate dehydrogenase/decarboxylase/D-malate dehydrogenase